MQKTLRWLAVLGLITALGCALTALASGLGYRFGYWHYRDGIGMLANVFWVALGAAIACTLILLAAAGMIATGRSAFGTLAMAFAGAAIAAPTAWVPYDLRMTANSVPAIHDISTDLDKPPEFVKVTALRGPNDHPTAYDGPKVAELQKKGYPDLGPLILKVPPDQVFPFARGAVIAMGLELVDADMAQGRIEATATSLLFGFKDDMVVRITAEGSGSRVDVRSKSRVGRNDFAQNARRIRAYQARLAASFG